MTTTMMLELLRRHAFVEEFRPEHIEKLTMLAREVQFSRDQVIFREGDECPQFYLITSGKVALELTVPGRTFRVQTLHAGDELGWSSLLMRSGRQFQARAMEPVVALVFDSTELQKACHEDSGFGYALMYRLLGVVSQRLQATRLQLLDVYSPKWR